MNYKEILDKKFEKAAMFGYKVDDVDDFLEEIANEFKKLTQQNEELEKKLEKMSERLSGYQEEEDSLRAALIGAQKLGDSVIRDSRAKADEIIRDAEYRAAKIVGEAQQKIDNEKYALTTLKKETAMFKNSLLSIYKQHLELISNIPQEEEEEVSEPVSEVKQEQPAQMSRESLDEAMSEMTPEETSAANEKTEESDNRRTSVFQKRHTSRIEEKFGPLKFGSDYNVANDVETAKK